MSGLISVAFVPRDGAVGFARAVLTSANFKWVVSERQFEEVHGLSRVVLLVPDKLATTCELLRTESVPDPGFLINLVVDLCSRYVQTSSGRPSEPPVEESLADRAFVFDGNEDGPVGNEPASLTSTIAQLRSRLVAARNLAVEDRELDLCAEALSLVSLADSLRELCLVYLNFVHPVLIKSRRQPGLTEEAIQEHFEVTNRLLLRRRRYLHTEYHGLLAEARQDVAPA